MPWIGYIYRPVPLTPYWTSPGMRVLHRRWMLKVQLSSEEQSWHVLDRKASMWAYVREEQQPTPLWRHGGQHSMPLVLTWFLFAGSFA